MPRPFRTPLVPLIPILGAVICIAQTILLPADTWMRLLIWMALGVLVYFFYGKKHSHLNRAE
jgi:APA family basic amino acid/polyamine antiporter